MDKHNADKYPMAVTLGADLQATSQRAEGSREAGYKQLLETKTQWRQLPTLEHPCVCIQYAKEQQQEKYQVSRKTKLGYLDSSFVNPNHLRTKPVRLHYGPTEKPISPGP